jgi:site-specific recombinase XerC
MAEVYSRLMAIPFYGAGLRLLECARLRVKEVDLGRNQITGSSGNRTRYPRGGRGPGYTAESPVLRCFTDFALGSLFASSHAD